MKIGILLQKDVAGGLVELKQTDSVSKGGTSHWWTSRQWQPINGEIELTLTNNSDTEVEIIVFKGPEPKK